MRRTRRTGRGGGGGKRGGGGGGRGGGGEEEEINHEDDKDDDCVCHSVNKISNCSHIRFFARNTLLIKSNSTDTH